LFYERRSFAPDEWVDNDSRIKDVDPHLPPSIPWSGEQLCKHFRSLKTKYVLVDEVFCWSGNLETGAGTDEADHFGGHIRRLLPNYTGDVHKLLLFAFWAFDKKPPKFISRAKPLQKQFDSSALASENNDSIEATQWKKVWVTNDTEALAKAVSSLAASQEELEQRVQLLVEQKYRGKCQEKRDFQRWKHSEF
jgi:hypothetical protein